MISDIHQLVKRAVLECQQAADASQLKKWKPVKWYVPSRLFKQVEYALRPHPHFKTAVQGSLVVVERNETVSYMTSYMYNEADQIVVRCKHLDE